MADPRDYVTPTVVGTPLRDGAVDPVEGDFLGPLNAGLAGEDGNPHGTNVVSPQIHASDGIRPVRPGAVSADAVQQDADEKDHLKQHLGIETEPDEPSEPEPTDPETGGEE